MFARFTIDETRSLCKERIEALEFWLRRLIDQKLSARFGAAYFESNNSVGQPLFGISVRRHAATRMTAEPGRYWRPVDTLLLDDEIKVILKEYAEFAAAFTPLFASANEARSFLNRVRAARNPLYHANPITVRQAEQAFCYSNDVLDVLKQHYATNSMSYQYDAPLIIQMSDSLGNVMHRAVGTEAMDFNHDFAEIAACHLHVGDLLTIEVEVDPAYDPSTYTIVWRSTRLPVDQYGAGASFSVRLTNQQVATQFDVQCLVTSNKSWHRKGAHDDFMLLSYRVLPA